MQVFRLSPQYWKAVLDKGACLTKGTANAQVFFPSGTLRPNALPMMTLLLNDNF